MLTLLFAAAMLHASLARADDANPAATATSDQAAGEGTTAAGATPEASGHDASDESAHAVEPTTAPAAATAPEAPAARTKPGRPADPIRLAQIERDLALLRDEEASTTRLLPMLTIALGVATVVTAATVGAVQALSCNDTCRADAWQGVTVIGGAAVATVGVLWLRWTNDDLRELGSRRYRLERERDDIGASTGQPRSARPARPRALVLGVRGQF